MSDEEINVEFANGGYINSNGASSIGPFTWNGYKRQSVSEMVREFHEVYDAYIGEEVGFPEDRHLSMRLALIREEYDELLDSIADGDVVETIDALGDLVYVIYGMALAMGVDLDKVVKEIHRSNLTKLDEDGNPIYADNMKVLKGPNYEPPDIKGVIGL